MLRYLGDVEAELGFQVSLRVLFVGTTWPYRRRSCGYSLAWRDSPPDVHNVGYVVAQRAEGEGVLVQVLRVADQPVDETPVRA